MGKITAQDDFTIKDILQNNSMVFKIPYNQRKYSWEMEQIEKFWDDFNMVVEKKRETHYMGVLSLIRTSEAKVSENEVIDGQQRLTTLILLIAALRDVYVALSNEKAANKIQEDYLLAVQTREVICKLKTSRVDTYTFENLVNINEGEGKDVCIRKDQDIILQKTKSRKVLTETSEFINKRMIESYELFYMKLIDRINQLDNMEDKNSFLLDIEEALSGLEIILISSNDQASLFLFFDSLNNRGLKLNQMDIIRNIFLRIISSKFNNEIENFSKSWDDLVIVLDEYDAVKFFKYYFMCTRENKIYASSDLPTVYEKYFEKIEILSEMKNEIRKIICYAKIFVRLFAKEYEDINDSKYIINIKRINEIGQQACHSFLMDYLYYIDDEERLNNITILIEKMMYRRAVTSASAKALDGIFKELIGSKKNIGNHYEYDDEIIKEKIIENSLEDNEFKEKIIKRKWDRSNLTSYTLRKYEYSLINNAGAYHKSLKSRKEVHIEHVMPENLNAQWIDYSKVTPDQHQSSFDKLGNLILLEFNINESIQDSIFSIKRQDSNYGKSELVQVKNLLVEYTEWNINTINIRTEKIADILLEICKINY